MTSVGQRIGEQIQRLYNERLVPKRDGTSRKMGDTDLAKDILRLRGLEPGTSEHYEQELSNVRTKLWKLRNGKRTDVGIQEVGEIARARCLGAGARHG